MSGCYKYDIINNKDESSDLDAIQISKDIVIDKDLYDTIQYDEYTILDAYIEDDSIYIRIEYGGRCGVVLYRLVSDGLFMESYPVQLNMILSFDDNDTCEALIRTTISTNLSNLAEYYRILYNSDHDSIIIHLEGFNEKIVYNF